MNQLQKYSFSTSDKLAEISSNLIHGISDRLVTIIPANFTGINHTCADPQGQHIYTTNGNVIYQFHPVPINGNMIRRIICFGNKEHFNKITTSLSGDTIFVEETSKKQILSIDSETGKKLATYELKDDYINELAASGKYLVLNVAGKQIKLIDGSTLKLISEFNPSGEESKYCCHYLVLDNEFDHSKTAYYVDSNKNCIFAVNLQEGRITGRFESFSHYSHSDIVVTSSHIYARDCYFDLKYNSVYQWDKHSCRIISRFTPSDGSPVGAYRIKGESIVAISKNDLWFWDKPFQHDPTQICSTFDLKSYCCVAGPMLVVSSGNKLLYWNLMKKKAIKPKVIEKHSTDISEIKQVGKHIFYTRNSSEIAIWRVWPERISCLFFYRFPQSSGVRSAMYVSSMKDLIITHADSHEIDVHHLDGSFKRDRLTHHKKSVRQTEMADDHILYSVSWDNTARQYDLGKKVVLLSYENPNIVKGNSCSILVDHENGNLFIGTYGAPEPKKETISMFDLKTGCLKKEFVFDAETDISVEVTKWNNTIIAGGGNRSLYFIHPETLEIVKSFQGITEYGIRRITIDHQKDKTYLTDEGGFLYVVNLKTGKAIKEKVSDKALILTVAIADRLYTIGSDGCLYCHTQQLKLVDKFKICNNYIWDMQHVQNDEMLLLACGDHTMKAVNLHGQPKYSLLNLKEGVLWFQENNSDGTPWFYTDQPELVVVAKKDKDGNITGILEITSEERTKHITFFNDKLMINNIIHIL